MVKMPPAICAAKTSSVNGVDAGGNPVNLMLDLGPEMRRGMNDINFHLGDLWNDHRTLAGPTIFGPIIGPSNAAIGPYIGDQTTEINSAVIDTGNTFFNFLPPNMPALFFEGNAKGEVGLGLGRPADNRIDFINNIGVNAEVGDLFLAGFNFFNAPAHFHNLAWFGGPFLVHDFWILEGNPTSATANTITDTGASFITYPVGTHVFVVHADGTTEINYIESNTATVLTFVRNFVTTPTTSSTYHTQPPTFDSSVVFNGNIYFGDGVGGDMGKVAVYSGDALDYLENQFKNLTSGVFSSTHTRVFFERVDDELQAYVNLDGFVGGLPEGGDGIIIYRDGTPTIEQLHDPYVMRSTTSHTYTGTAADMPLDAELSASDIGTIASDQFTSSVDGNIIVDVKICVSVNGGSPTQENLTEIKLQRDTGSGFTDVTDGAICIYSPDFEDGCGCGHLKVQVASEPGDKYKVVMTRLNSTGDTMENNTGSTIHITPAPTATVDNVYTGLTGAFQPVSATPGDPESGGGVTFTDIGTSDLDRNGSYTCGPLTKAFRLGGLINKEMQADGLVVDPGSDWSVSFWWRTPSSWSNDGDQVAHIAVRNSNGEHFTIYWFDGSFGSTSVNWGVAHSKDADDAGNTYQIADALGTTTCYHAVVTWNQTDEELKYYLNGTLDTTDTTAGSYPAGVLESSAYEPGLIGSAEESGNGVDVSQLAFYQKTLSATAVSALYNGGSGVSL